MKYKKVLSIVSFSILLATFLAAIITDIVLFKDAIMTFIGAIIVGAAAFIFFIILMILSIMMVFGVIILKNEGFWPFTLAVKAFKDVLNDISFTASQITTFQTLRYVFLVLLISSFVLSIIALHKGKDKKVPLKGMSVITLIFSLLGILSSLGFLAISSTLL